MRDPELRSPQEWAEELRDESEMVPMDDITPCTPLARVLTDTDCRELADRMDDLTEAVGLLRSLWDNPDRDAWLAVTNAAALLAKYASEEG